MKTRNFSVGLCTSVTASLFAVVSFAETHVDNRVVMRSSVESVYYPGYLSRYAYADGSFVYSLSPPMAQPEVFVAPSPPPKQTTVTHETSQVSSVAAFAPNQGAMSQVMLSGFSVHVGSFLESSGADGLEDLLREHGIPSFRTPVLLDGISFVQLHVGPFQWREDAENVKLSMERTLNIPGILLSHGLIPPP